MILPFSDSKKAIWNLEGCLGDIDRIIQETNPKEFQLDLEVLYPKLQKYGLILAINDPALFQGMSYEYQITALKDLRRHVRAGTFDLRDWNENSARLNTWLEKQK